MSNHQIVVQGEDISYGVTYDYQPAERPNYDINSRNCGPGCEAEVTITEIMVRPHGYPGWFTTDVAKWDKHSNEWDLMMRECELNEERAE
jgi:hypothetical protein